ncbi:MAG: hypothetical protein ACKO1Y_00450 [Actinomycetota bacterium]
MLAWRDRVRWRDRLRWRPRSVGIGVLLAGLVLGVLGLARTGPPAQTRVAAAPSRADSEPGVGRPAPRPVGMPDLGAPCRPEPEWSGWWRCRVAGVAVVARSARPDEVDVLYGRLVAPTARPGAGPAACAAGRPEERSWSRPEDPERAVGRYRCRTEGGRAELWWSDRRGLVARADAADGDLGRLFSWWTRRAGA